ncbi:MAG: PhoH family protein [Spirochaetales bacterium]|nr:PhoH family protein [Spirochaetales bacterium]
MIIRNPDGSPKKEFKSFVLDTNVFIHRPDALLSFKDNEIIIPLWVLEELDKLKSGGEERARNARQAIRQIDNLGKKGRLSEGVYLQEINSILRIAMAFDASGSLDLDMSRMDNKIILSALKLKREGRNVFFVSKDINARVKALALGLTAVDYEKQKVNIDSLYTGFLEVEAPVETRQSLETNGQVAFDRELPANQFVQVNTPKEKGFVLTRYNAEEKSLWTVQPQPQPISGIRALNLKQQLAFDLLLDPKIQLVTLVGKAGTGKTLLAIAAALSQTLESRLYSRILVSRPVIPMGKDIGFLPGNKDEKMSNWMQPLFDNLDFLISQAHSQSIKSADQLIKAKVIEIEALSFIRGRSLPNQYIIIDEAQNLSPHEIKTVVSRAGKDTKVVLTGDPFQIDNPYLDSSSNGLTYLVEAFKGQPLYGHIFLDKSERSELAELAAELL